MSETTHVVDIAKAIIDAEVTPTKHAFKRFEIDGKIGFAGCVGLIVDPETGDKIGDWVENTDLVPVEGSDTIEQMMETIGFFKVALGLDGPNYAITAATAFILANPEASNEDYEEFAKNLQGSEAGNALERGLDKGLALMAPDMKAFTQFLSEVDEGKDPRVACGCENCVAKLEKEGLDKDGNPITVH